MLWRLPCLHHKRIIHCKANEAVDAIRLEHTGELIKTRQVHAGAGGFESNRQRKQHHRFAFEQSVAVDLLPCPIAPDRERDLQDFVTFA